MSKDCPNGCGEMEYHFEGIGYECSDCGKFIGHEEL